MAFEAFDTMEKKSNENPGEKREDLQLLMNAANATRHSGQGKKAEHKEKETSRLELAFKLHRYDVLMWLWTEHPVQWSEKLQFFDTFVESSRWEEPRPQQFLVDLLRVDPNLSVSVSTFAGGYFAHDSKRRPKIPYWFIELLMSHLQDTASPLEDLMEKFPYRVISEFDNPTSRDSPELKIFETICRRMPPLSQQSLARLGIKVLTCRNPSYYFIEALVNVLGMDPSCTVERLNSDPARGNSINYLMLVTAISQWKHHPILQQTMSNILPSPLVDIVLSSVM